MATSENLTGLSDLVEDIFRLSIEQCAQEPDAGPIQRAQIEGTLPFGRIIRETESLFLAVAPHVRAVEVCAPELGTGPWQFIDLVILTSRRASPELQLDAARRAARRLWLEKPGIKMAPDAYRIWSALSASAGKRLETYMLDDLLPLALLEAGLEKADAQTKLDGLRPIDLPIDGFKRWLFKRARRLVKRELESQVYGGGVVQRDCRGRIIGSRMTSWEATPDIQDWYAAEGAVDTPESLLIAQEEERETFEAYSALASPQQREILLLVRQGFSIVQIAEARSISPKTVYAQLDRLKKKLRHQARQSG